MIAFISKKLTYILGKYEPMTEEQRAISQYAFDIMIYTIISTLGLLFIGFLCGKTIPTIVCIGLFYINQSFGGGYHANTHFRCFIVMVLGLFAFLIAISIPFPVWIVASCNTVALILLFCKPLELHPNKRYLENHRSLLIRRSRIIIVIEAVVSMLLYVFQSNLQIEFSMGLLLSAISRLTAAQMHNSSDK